MSTPGSWSAKINTNSSSDHHGSDWPGGAASSKDGKASLYHTEGGRGGDEGDGSVRMVKTARVSNRQLVLDQLTKDRNRVLDDWADAGTLGLTPDEVAINKFQRKHLKFLFGETGFNPPVPARNPVSVNMHNPRFSAALWAVNTEAYRRKGSLTRSQKEVIALGVSLSNNCPHCAYIHTAMGAAAGSDVPFSDLQRFYQTKDPEAGFPMSDSPDPLVRRLASWSIKHRDREERERTVPCTPEQLPEVLGTMMLFTILNRVVDAFVSKIEAGPMFPLPVRLMMKFDSMSPVVQRMMSTMMSWMMHEEDGKVKEGQVLRDINKIAPIVKGYEGCTDEPPLTLPEELSWAKSNDTIKTAIAFLAAEAELMGSTFVPHGLRAYMIPWVSSWDGGRAPLGTREEWLEPAVMESKMDLNDVGSVAMLRMMLLTVVASDSLDDNILSQCQEVHGVRGTHAAVLWAAFLAAQRVCQLAVEG